MFCVECGTQKEVDINMFWQRTNDQRNRFRQVKCSCCQTVKRLGTWLRRPHETYNSVQKWLQHNNTYDSKTRHATMTADLFFTQYIGEGLIETNDVQCAEDAQDISITPHVHHDSHQTQQRNQVKRPLPEVSTEDMNKRRRDTQASSSTDSANAVQTNLKLCYAQTMTLQPVSKQLQLFVRMHVNKEASLQGLEAGGRGDCLFHSIGARCCKEIL